MVTPEFEMRGSWLARKKQSTMPDFAMPDPSPESSTTPRGDPAETSPVASAAAAAQLRLARSPDRRRLLLAALLGVLVGMVVPAGIAAAEQVAARARSDSLRATASAYLAAIAEGRSDEATALVPLPVLPGPTAARAVPDAVLRSADRIREASVPFVHVADRTGLVVVRYRVGDRSVTRTLEAEHVDGAWRSVSSLAEAVAVRRVEEAGGASVAGVELAGAVVQLYPGVYRFDVLEGALIDSGGDVFEVDGDPGTRTEAVSGSRIAPAVRDRVVRVALAAAAACQEQDGCVLDPDAAVRVREEVTLRGPASGTGPVDFVVPLEALVGGAERRTEMRIRVAADAQGQPAAWLCSTPGAPDGALSPCP